MDVFDAISERHSYRGAFQDEPVPREDLQRIVQTALDAPSGCNAQTTSFVIVDDPDTLAAMAAIVDKPVMHAAKAVIACVVEHRDVYHGMSFGVEDCAAAVENMLLAITAMGYATVWMDGALRVEKRAERVREILGIPEHLELRILLPLGRPAEDGPRKEKLAFSQRAWFDRYGG
jgi:nitroreductase